MLRFSKTGLYVTRGIMQTRFPNPKSKSHANPKSQKSCGNNQQPRWKPGFGDILPIRPRARQPESGVSVIRSAHNNFSVGEIFVVRINAFQKPDSGLQDLGFGVWDLGFGVWGLELGFGKRDCIIPLLCMRRLDTERPTCFCPVAL